MTILETIRKRYSCRAYREKSIEKEKLDIIFEAARFAPSAKNLQDWRFVIVTDKETKQKIAKAACSQMFLEKAGAIIVACSNNSDLMRCGQPIAAVDVAIALEHIALQAVELGLGTCWIGSFFPDQVRAVLDIPDEVAVVELMPIGYPADEPRKTSRDPVEKIVCYEKWQF